MRIAVRTAFPLFAILVFSAAGTLAVPTGALAQQNPPRTDSTPSTGAAPAAGAPATDATPPATASAPEGNPADLLAKAEELLKAQKFEEAMAAFNDTLAASQVAAQQGGGIENLRLQTRAAIGRARALTGMKEFDSAEKDLVSITTEDPTNVPALIALGQLKLETGKADDVETAMDNFQKAVKADSKNIEAQFGYGKSLIMLGRADEAIAPLTRVITADPQNGEAHRLRGVGYGYLYKTKQAVDDLQQAIQVNPDDYEAYFSLGAAMLRAEDYQSAIDQFGKAIEHYKPKPGQEDVPFLQGYLTRSSAYLELGKNAKDAAAKEAAFKAAYAEAEKIASQLDRKNPLYSSALAAALSSRGVAERMLGQLPTAIRTFTQAIELRTISGGDESTARFLSDTYFRRGICFHLIGEDKMALSDFQAAAHLATDDPRANLWEGFTYAKMGEYQQALRAYGDAIAASDRYTPAYYNRGLCYMMLGDYRKAISDFNDAIRLEPGNADYYFKRGLAYKQLGDNQKASESFAVAIEFKKTHAGAHRHMSDVMQRLGRSELATQYRQKAEQLAPKKSQ